MANIKKTIKTGLIAGLCGLGFCALAKKLKLTTRLATMAHSIEGIPFPGPHLYAFLTTRQLMPMYEEIAEEIASSGISGNILELGTGAGYLCIEIAKRLRGSHVVGVDKSQDMIQIAQANLRTTDVKENLEFSRGETDNLPFPGRYFDFVVNVAGLHHWKRPSIVFEEVYHILSPGGSFWVYDYRQDVPEEVWERAASRLPLYLYGAFLLGPKASWKSALEEREVLEIGERSHFINPESEPKSLTIFGQKLPVFNRYIFRKPVQ